MERKSMVFALAMSVVVVSGAARAGDREAPVEVNVEGLPPQVAADVRKHAKEGVTSLNRYLVHTSRQHGLAVADVVKKPVEPAAQNAAQPSKEYRNYARNTR
jgi:hypothetical protein